MERDTCLQSASVLSELSLFRSIVVPLQYWFSASFTAIRVGDRVGAKLGASLGSEVGGSVGSSVSKTAVSSILRLPDDGPFSMISRESWSQFQNKTRITGLRLRDDTFYKYCCLKQMVEEYRCRRVLNICKLENSENLRGSCRNINHIHRSHTLLRSYLVLNEICFVMLQNRLQDSIPSFADP